MKAEMKPAFDTWARSFLGAKTQPMTEQQSRMFLVLILSEARSDPMPSELYEFFLYKVATKRAGLAGLRASKQLIAMLSVISSTPGEVVMYVYALAYAQREQQLEVMDIGQFTRCFPMGFLTEEEIDRVWDEQKCDRGNMLDFISDVQSIC